MKDKEIMQMMIDMINKTPVQIYVKYGVGIQTQEKIKMSAVKTALKNTVDGYCTLCKEKLILK